MGEAVTITSDVLIVGGGPGGIAAAVTAGEAGARVAIIDDNPGVGGQIWRNSPGHPPGRVAGRWIGRLRALQSVTSMQGCRVVARPADGVLLAEGPAGPVILKYKSLVLATGARELFLPFPGWTLPGVLGAGGMQALVKGGLRLDGKRVVVAGSGPLLLAVAALLRSSRAAVPIVAEQAAAEDIAGFARWLARRRPAKLLAAATLRARLIGTPYSPDTYVTGVARERDGLVVHLRRGQVSRAVACDYLACGFHLVPNGELPVALGCEAGDDGAVRVDAMQRTTVSNVFAVGELTGIGGADKAIAEGRVAAMAAVGADARAGRLAARCAAHREFAETLSRTFRLRDELFELATPDTIVCRCEDVPLSALGGCNGTRDAKLQTRCGMGACQGRICEPFVARIVGGAPRSVRPPVMPAAITTLAAAGDVAKAERSATGCECHQGQHFQPVERAEPGSATV